MILNWTEVDLELFKEVFDRYWNHEEGTMEKVIEVQNLPFLLTPTDNTDGRVFFGSGYNIEDFVDWNKDEYEILKRIEKLAKMVGMEGLENKHKLSMCMFENGPKIIPLGASPDHYNIIMTLFGDNSVVNNELKEITEKFMSEKLTLDYFKDSENDTYYIKEDGDSNIDFPQRLRVRIWPIDEWKKMVKSYTDNNFRLPEEYTKDDISLDKIKTIE